MKKEPMKRISEIDVKVVKMKESSGNEQFFVRMVRNDSNEGFFSTSAILEHSCWQTKHLSKEECLQRAWFDASYLVRFLGIKSMDEVVIIGLEDDEIEILKSSMTLLRE